jgi:hypothetical protein
MNLNKVFELFPGAKLGIARVRPIRAGVPVPTSHPAGSLTKLGALLLCAAFTLCTAVAAPKPKPGTLQPVNLGAAAPFAVLAGTGVTNAGSSSTVINGDLGLFPADGTAITGFTGENAPSNCCGIVNGTIEDTGFGEPGKETLAAAHGAASLVIAINDAKGRPCPAGQVIQCLLPSAELGGKTFTSGVYTFADVATLSGILTLSGNGVYIFQLGALTVNPGGTVVLAGAQAAKVFWVTTQATLDSSLAFAGNILSTTSITFTGAGGTTLTGRALAQTLVSFSGPDTVTRP